MPSQARDKDLEDNVALAGKRDAELPSLNQVEPSVCEAFLGSGILDCPVTYRASYPPFLGFDVEILSFTHLQRGRDKTWRDMRPRLVSPVDRWNDSRHCQIRNCFGDRVRGADVHLALTSSSRFFRMFCHMKNWFAREESARYRSSYVKTDFLTRWYMSYARFVRTTTFVIKLVLPECITDLCTFRKDFRRLNVANVAIKIYKIVF